MQLWRMDLANAKKTVLAIELLILVWAMPAY